MNGGATFSNLLMSEKETDQYTDEEAQRRFEAALRGAREVGHESMKDIPTKRSKPHSVMKIGKRNAKAGAKATKKPGK